MDRLVECQPIKSVHQVSPSSQPIKSVNKVSNSVSQPVDQSTNWAMRQGKMYHHQVAYSSQQLIRKLIHLNIPVS